MGKQIFAVTALSVLTVIACSRQETTQTTNTETAVTNTATPVADGDDTAVPWRKAPVDQEAIERERFDEQWRNLESFRAAQAAAQKAQVPQINVRFAPNGKESFEGVAPEAINAAPVVVPLKGDVAGPSVLKTQVYLDRAGFSVGPIDGRWGRNSSIALWWFQRARGVNATEPGALDEQTFRTLAGLSNGAEVVMQRPLTAEDVEGPFTKIPDDVYDQEKLKALSYESLGEKLAERFHTTVEFLQQLNPGRNLAEVKAGEQLWVPNVREPVMQDRKDIARVVVSIKGNTFNAFDQQGNLLFHAPTTLGSEYDPSPSETLEVKKITFDPWFHYQPKLFYEVDDSEPEANLPPGPNSPVGIVWIALSKKHFGIHGTSSPDTIGYASSHGCIRLTNWDAREMGHRLAPGVTIEFIDTRSEAAAATTASASGS